MKAEQGLCGNLTSGWVPSVDNRDISGKGAEKNQLTNLYKVREHTVNSGQQNDF